MCQLWLDFFPLFTYHTMRLFVRVALSFFFWCDFEVRSAPGVWCPISFVPPLSWGVSEDRGWDQIGVEWGGVGWDGVEEPTRGRT